MRYTLELVDLKNNIVTQDYVSYVQVVRAMSHLNPSLYKNIIVHIKH